MVVASPPMDGSSAQKAGLKKGDFVTLVAGRDTAGMSSFDVVELVSQSESATLDLAVKSAATGAERTLSLPRKVTFYPTTTHTKCQDTISFVNSYLTFPFLKVASLPFYPVRASS
jgi:C-terminal processing protease CtpA/Prc